MSPTRERGSQRLPAPADVSTITASHPQETP